MSGGSPIMNYGGDDDTDYLGGFCPPGTQLNVIVVVIIGLIILYYAGLFEKREGFYMDLNSLPDLKEGGTFVDFTKKLNKI